MKTVKDTRQDILKNPKVQVEYDRLEPEFRLVSMLIEARTRAGLSQEAVAERKGMKQASDARIESGKNNPSVKTLQRYAEAIKCSSVSTAVAW